MNGLEERNNDRVIHKFQSTITNDDPDFEYMSERKDVKEGRCFSIINFLTEDECKYGNIINQIIIITTS